MSNKTKTTLKQCLDWLNLQIAFNPDHPDWEIILEIIDRLDPTDSISQLRDTDQTRNTIS